MESIPVEEVTTADHDRLSEIFDAIDADKSGEISPTELIVHLLGVGQEHESVSGLFSAMDTDGNGSISREEFIAGCDQVTALQRLQRLSRSAAALRLQPCAHGAKSDDARPPCRTKATSPVSRKRVSARWHLLKAANVRWIPRKTLSEDAASHEVLQALSRLDDRLVEVLRSGALRLLRSAWLNQQPDTYRLQWRQELEKLDEQGASSALLSPEEAVALVQACNRGVGALTHGAPSSMRSNAIPSSLAASTDRSMRQVGSRRATLIRRVSVSKLCSRRLQSTRTSRVYFGSALLF